MQQPPVQLVNVMRVSKLVPVPKGRARCDTADKNKFRGIAISSVFSRVPDRLLLQRLDQYVERKCLRASTQCGFRKGHGTLDALFALDHCINKAKHANKTLYVVFVDFKKAFDTVPRDVMLARCRQLGVHGPFMQALEALYADVQHRVAVNGDLGDAFTTHTGTKQGSEVSPLLFGMFLDTLHELLDAQVPGAGPVLSGMHLNDILYADDGVLLSFDSTENAQKLLDCLALFCDITGMVVNTDSPEKTCVVAFRRHTTVVRNVHLTYKGVVLPVREAHVYLGVLMHATKGFKPASNSAGCCRQSSQAFCLSCMPSAVPDPV